MGARNNLKRSVKKSIDTIVDSCYAYPQYTAGALVSGAAAFTFYRLGIDPAFSLAAGIAAYLTAGSIIVHAKKEDFSHLLTAGEYEKDIERRIAEFEASEEGKSRGLLVKIKDSIIKYPKTIAAALTIAALRDHIPNQLVNIPWLLLTQPDSAGRAGKVAEYYAKVTLSEVVLFSMTYLISKSLKGRFHSAFYRKNRYAFKGELAELAGKKEAAIRAYEEENRLGGNFYARIAGINMKMDPPQMDTALRNLSEAARKKRHVYGLDTDLKKMLVVNVELRLKRKIKREPDEPKNWLRLAFHHYRLFDVGRSLEVMEEAGKQLKDDSRIRFLHGEMLESNSRIEEAREKYREGGIILLQNSDIRENFSLVGDFRNELLVHKFDEYIKNLIAIKRNSRTERLKIEKQQIQAFKPYFGRRISDFLCDLELKGFYHLLLRYIDGKNIHQLISDGHYGQNRDSDLLADLKECIALLKDIENIGMWAFKDNKIALRDPLSESRGYFPGRIANALELLAESGVLLAEDEKKRIIDGFYCIAAPLHAMPRRFYTDSNIMNFMKDDEIRKVDFENDELLPPFNFFVNTCEFGSDYLDEDAKDELKHLYWGDEFDVFDNFLPFGAAQRHMEMAGYRSRDIINARKKGGDVQWPLKARGFHLEKAAGYCTGIIENAGDYEIYIRKPGLKNIEAVVKTIDSVSAGPQIMQ